MRKFWVISLVFCLALFSHFSNYTKVEGQDLPRGGNEAYFINSTNNLFDALERSYISVLENSGGEKASQETKDNVKAFQDHLNGMRTSYQDAFSKTLNSNNSSFIDSHIEALKAVTAYKDNPNNTRLMKYQNQQNPLWSAYIQFGNQLKLLFIEAGKIRSGADINSDEVNQTDPSTIENATKGNTNPVTSRTTKPPECSILGEESIASCIESGVAWIIKVTLLQIAGFFLWLAGNLLNLSVGEGIFNFAKWSPSYLYETWLIFRQIISVFVVLGVVWLGIMYMIGRDEKFGRYVAWTILFALFVNFSYPVTRFVTDISNKIAATVYVEALGVDLEGRDSAGAQIMARLGMQEFIGGASKSPDLNNYNNLKDISNVPGALMAVIFIFYAAWVLFMFSLMLVSRTLIISLSIIASPLMFVDSVVPQLGKAASKLRGLFMEQLFVAPVFMIMLALSLKFFEVFGGKNSITGVSNLASAGSVPVFFNMLFMLLMLHITYKVTKSLSGEIGNTVTGYLSKGLGLVAGAGLGAGAGLALRAGLGRAALAARESSWMKNSQDTLIGRGARSITNSLANSSFDVRNSRLVSKGMGMSGIPLGKGGASKGFERDLQNKLKDRRERFEQIEQVYKKDIFDKDGKLVHRKGDINMEGEVAANRFISRSGGVMFDKDKVREELKLSQEKVNNSVFKDVESASSDYLKQYNNAKEENKVAVFNNLKSQLESIQKNGGGEGVTGRALDQTLRDIAESKQKEAKTLQEKVISEFEIYKTLPEEKKATYIAKQSGNVKSIMEKLKDRGDYMTESELKDYVEGQTRNTLNLKDYETTYKKLDESKKLVEKNMTPPTQTQNIDYDTPTLLRNNPDKFTEIQRGKTETAPPNSYPSYQANTPVQNINSQPQIINNTTVNNTTNINQTPNISSFDILNDDLRSFLGSTRTAQEKVGVMNKKIDESISSIRAQNTREAEKIDSLRSEVDNISQRPNNVVNINPANDPTRPTTPGGAAVLPQEYEDGSQSNTLKKAA